MVKTEFEFRTKCRSCFSEEQEMHYLFGEFDQGLSLSSILKSTTSFLVEENDGLSPYLCENCTTIVIDFYNFKTVYEENEKYIKSLLKDDYFKSNIMAYDGGNVMANAISNENHTEEEINELTVVTYDEESSKCGDIEVKHKETEKNKDIEIKELLIAGEFIKPQDIFKREISVKDESSSDYIAEKVEIIDSIKYSCAECGDCFILKSRFQQHMLLKHKTSEIEERYKTHKKYICEHCGASFTKKSYLEDHSEIHTTEKRHVCPMCGKAFRRRTVLVKHKKIHTHPRQCVCEICGLRFNDKGTLKTHIKLKHTKERNFYCNICGLLFPLKSTLEKHIFRHNENRGREFICSICHMGYKDKSSLNRHTIVKHSENAKKPSCTYCGKQYTTNTNLLKHIRKHHSSVECKNEFESE